MATECVIPVVVITGTVGAGKTTVMGAMSEVLKGRGIRHAAIDQDALRMVHPYPDGEPFGATVGYRNLAALWPNLVGYGVRCVIIADVVENMAASRAAYVTAMPGTKVTVVRLIVPMPLILRRLEGRETGASLAWSQRRAPELHGIQQRERVGDLVIDVGGRPPHEIAEEIIGKLDLA
ncbi:MAG: hypothetical protein M3457_15540 [Chloroflexota bacterium]|nr:hypothetical protein [Chloroflexota bacterium]